MRYTIEQMATMLNMRIGQFIFNATQPVDGISNENNIFYIEDDELYYLCTEYFTKHKK